MSKNVYEIREFLNSDVHMTAYIKAIVPPVEVDKEGHVWGFSPDLEIKDCSESIYLDFSINRPKDIPAIQTKLKLLQEVINKFVEHSLEQIDEYSRLKALEPKEPEEAQATSVEIVS